MINFSCKEGDVRVATFTGTLNDITADLMLEIGMIYSAIEDSDKMQAKMFKQLLRGMFTDEYLNKKVFGGLKLPTSCKFDPDEELEDDEDDEDDDVEDVKESKAKKESLGCRLNNILDELFSLDPDELSKELDKALKDLDRKKKAGK